MRTKFANWLLLSLFICSCACAQNAALQEASIPAALKEWRPWVLKGYEYRACPFVANQMPSAAENFICAWPGKLSITTDAKGASFTQRWRLEAQEWIALPGDAEHWPQELTVNGQRFPVSALNGEPALRLEPGSYEIRARIPWSERPQSLRVPAGVGLVELNVDGKAIAPIERQDESLTLGRAASSALDAESLSLRVFRKISDGLPPLLQTRIEFDVAGAGREAVLGPILPPEFVPTSLESELPARLDPDGKLHIQLRPGTWTLDVASRSLGVLNKLSAVIAPAPWPQEEIWSYESAPGLRVTNASSAVSIDPAQAGVPDEWRGLPAFAMQKGGELAVEERARGLADADTNRLHLQREAWLDFSGRSLFAKDRISGRMVRDWRLNVAAPFSLTRAEADGEGLLITQIAGNNGAGGVELRNPNVNLSAGIHIDSAGGSLPINGWQQAFDSVAFTLHLPYGYRLLGAPGADNAYGTWISNWTLLDVFVVAIVFLLGWRLLGAVGGLALLLYLVLGYQEPGAPLWALGVAVVFGLIARALPAGKLARAANAGGRIALIALVLTALPFAAEQVRFSLYPQLEQTQWASVAPQQVQFAPNENAQPIELGRLDKQKMNDAPVTGAEDEYRGAATAAVPATPMLGGKSAKKEESRAKSADQASANGSISQLTSLRRYAENTNIQAGRGEPGWQYGSTYSLSWSGPVVAEQSMRLVVAPPWLVRILRLLLAGMLAFVAYGLIRSGFARKATAQNIGAMAGVCLAIAGAFTTHPASAQGAPSAELLNELRNRLIEAPKCAPSCALLAWARVDAQGDDLSIAMEAHAAERVAFPVPSAERMLTLKSVTLDGIAQDGLLQWNDQVWLAVPRGVHRIELRFNSVSADKISLPFPLKPARVEFSGNGWESGGITEDRLLTETLELVRLRDSNSQTSRGAAQQFPPYVELTRNIKLDLDWQIENEIRRIAPQEGGISVEFGLLKNEHVITPQMKVKDNRVIVPIPDGQDETAWSSQLDKSDTIVITAPAISDHAEIWKITQSPTWHAEFSGVPAVQPEAGASYWIHEFHPLPGETLTITVGRPEAIAGASLAIDAVSLSSRVGARAVEQVLSLSVRSTQGGEHVIALPQEAEILAINKNGQPMNLRPRDGKLSLPITPATQNFEIRWRENREIGVRVATPTVNLNSPAANINIQLGLPADRWILWTSGPTVGPAVLYWGELIVMILLAIGLSRFRRTPLKLRHWLLLGIGFSTFSWSALLLVIAWLLALDWRLRNPLRHDGAFNLVQIALALLTMAALLCLVGSIPFGLLGQPDMHLSGNDSVPTALRWFADQSFDQLAQGVAISLPLWSYKLAMLLWALWLANALIGWLRWGFSAWSQGDYWRSSPRKKDPVAATNAAEPS